MIRILKSLCEPVILHMAEFIKHIVTAILPPNINWDYNLRHFDICIKSHSWGNGSRKQRKKKKHSGRKQSTKHHSKGTKIKQST